MATDSGVDLGERLRALRIRNHWRISDVTRMTGVAASTISKVENGRMSLTYDKLQQLATGLSLDLADLFTDRKQSETPELGAARRSLGRAGQGVVVEASSYEYRFLNADLAPKQMVPIIGEAKARTLEEFGELVKHDGEEFLLVLEGAGDGPLQSSLTRRSCSTSETTCTSTAAWGMRISLPRTASAERS